MGLFILSGWSLAQTTTLQRTAMQVEKCGANTVKVLNECGIGAFKNVYIQCYDGYEEKQGGESSCKSSEVWQKYAESICEDRCRVVQSRVIPTTEEAVSVTEGTISDKGVAPVAKSLEPELISVCYISEKLTRDYNVFMLELKEAESAGDKIKEKEIRNKIFDLKLQIKKSKEECEAGAQQPEADEPSIEPAIINRCQDVTRQEGKLAYYKSLRSLSDAEVIQETGFPKEELGIEQIIAEISEKLEKVKEQCSLQIGTFEAKPITSVEKIRIAEPVNPVVAESGQEIDIYYKARIERITTVVDVDEQIQGLKTLREEIDELIEKLIKSRKEIEADELGNLIIEIKVSKGEIKADDVVVKTTAKKMLMKIGDKSISIEPTENDVLIRDSGLEVKATELFIRENVLRVGNAEVGLAASYVVGKLAISPKSVELKEENEKAVYKIEVEEPRKLFGFIPLTIQKTITIDAGNGDPLEERRPWYAFLTTK